MGLKDKFKKTARETSEKITSGVKEAQHLGKYTAPMIEQEIYSLRNTKPMFRAGKWDKRLKDIRFEINKKLARNQNSIMCQVWLRDLEAIQNER